MKNSIKGTLAKLTALLHLFQDILYDMNVEANGKDCRLESLSDYTNEAFECVYALGSILRPITEEEDEWDDCDGDCDSDEDIEEEEDEK